MSSDIQHIINHHQIYANIMQLVYCNLPLLACRHWVLRTWELVHKPQMWSTRCFLPDVLAPLSPSCFPVVFQMSKRSGLPIVSHCPVLVSILSCRPDVVSQLSPVALQMWSSDFIPMVSHFVPDMLSQWFSTCLRQSSPLPVVSQMVSHNDLSVHVSPR